MTFNVLVGEPRDILRTGLYTIFSMNERVTTVYKASNIEELQQHLQKNSIDLTVVNQIIVPDITTLPSNRFVILTTEFNITTFLTAYKHGARGYLLETSQSELFYSLLSLPQGAFLIEPSMTAHLVEHLTKDIRFLIKEELLTPREREVVRLLRGGVDRHTIAQQLNISSTTLKTHIKNIFRKRIDIKTI